MIKRTLTPMLVAILFTLCSSYLAMAESSSLIDINTANVEQLTSLPGIGQTKATAIVVHREKHGRFLIVEDLTEVPGIGNTLLDSIRDKITIGTITE